MEQDRYKKKTNKVSAVAFNISDEIMQKLEMEHIYNDWNREDFYYDELFFEFDDRWGFEPIAVGFIREASPFTSVSSFREEVAYLFFDAKDTHKEEWPAFEKLVIELGASWTYGSWEQIIHYKGVL
jgi:hypothetical protein